MWPRPRTRATACSSLASCGSFFVKPQDRDVVCHASAWDGKAGPAQRGARSVQRHRPAHGEGAPEDRLPALRAADRPVALEGVFGPDSAGEVQRDVVGVAAEVPGNRRAGRAQRGRLRRRRQVSRRGECPIFALLPGGHFAVPVPPRAGEDRGLHGSAEPLLGVSEPGGGRRFAAMLEMGISRPWPDALEALTGQREMDATAIRDYFAPLQKWLDEQNKGKPVGW